MKMTNEEFNEWIYSSVDATEKISTQLHWILQDETVSDEAKVHARAAFEHIAYYFENLNQFTKKYEEERNKYQEIWDRWR